MISKLSKFTPITRRIFVSSNLIKFSTLPYLQKNDDNTFSFIKLETSNSEGNSLDIKYISESEVTVKNLVRYINSPVLWSKHGFNTTNKDKAKLSEKYSELAKYLNTSLKSLLKDNSRVSQITMVELNSLLEIIIKLNSNKVYGELKGIDENLIELIFNNKSYIGGYDQATIKSLLNLLFNLKNNNTSNINSSIGKLNSKLLNYLIQDKFKFDEANLVSIINSLFNYNQLESINSLYVYLKDNHSDLLDQNIYHQFIKGYSIKKDLLRCEELVNNMKSSNLTLSYTSINSLIHGYGNIGKFDKLKDILDDIINKMDKNQSRPLAQVQTIFSYLIKSTEYRPQLNELIDKIQQNSYSKDLDYYNIMIEYKVNNGEIEVSKELLKEMESSGILANTTSYNPLITYYVEKEDLPEASQLFFNFKESIELNSTKSNSDKKRKIGKVIYNQLIKLACKNQNLKLSNQLIELAKAENIKLTPYTFAPLMNCYFNMGKYKQSIKLYNNIKNYYNFEFNPILFDIYLKSIYSIGDLNLGKGEFFKIFNNNSAKLDEQLVNTNAFGIGQSGTIDDILEFLNNPRFKEFINEGCYIAAYKGLQVNPRYLEGEGLNKAEEFRTKFNIKT